MWTPFTELKKDDWVLLLAEQWSVLILMVLVFAVEATHLSVGFVFLSAKGEAGRLPLRSWERGLDSSRNKPDPSVCGSVVCDTVFGEVVLILRMERSLQPLD